MICQQIIIYTVHFFRCKSKYNTLSKEKIASTKCRETHENLLTTLTIKVTSTNCREKQNKCRYSLVLPVKMLDIAKKVFTTLQLKLNISLLFFISDQSNFFSFLISSNPVIFKTPAGFSLKSTDTKKKCSYSLISFFTECCS